MAPTPAPLLTEYTFCEEITAFFAADRQSPVLGSKAFKQTLRVPGSAVDLPDLKQVSVRPTVEQIVASCVRHFVVDKHTILTSKRGRQASNPARAMAMYLCQEEGAMRLADIAGHFGLQHYASAGASIRQFRRRLKDDVKLDRLLDPIKLDLNTP